MEKKKNMAVFAVVAGMLAVAVFAFGVFTVVSFVLQVTRPTVRLENGGIITVSESRRFNIFIEDYAPPPSVRHEFVFINTENNNRSVSFAPTNDWTYAVGMVVINNEPRSGRFGRLVAQVELEPGNFLVEFAPSVHSGEFVWGSPLDGLVWFIVQVFGLAIAFFALLTVVIILLVKRNQAARVPLAPKWQSRPHSL